MSNILIAQLVILNASTSRGFLSLGSLSVACALGRGGVEAAKREGDGSTPAGVFPLRRVFFRPDRLTRPATRLECHALNRKSGWCDDPASSVYNKLVRLPFSASHEILWRDDHLYDIFVELGYNDRPAIPRHGSAIFLHLCREDFAPTQGCIAIPRRAMIRLLACLRPGDAIQVKK